MDTERVVNGGRQVEGVLQEELLTAFCSSEVEQVVDNMDKGAGSSVRGGQIGADFWRKIAVERKFEITVRRSE